MLDTFKINIISCIYKTLICLKHFKPVSCLSLEQILPHREIQFHLCQIINIDSIQVTQLSTVIFFNSFRSVCRSVLWHNWVHVIGKDHQNCAKKLTALLCSVSSICAELVDNIELIVHIYIRGTWIMYIILYKMDNCPMAPLNIMCIIYNGLIYTCD